MCGIGGIISPRPGVVNRETLTNMATALAHRGPDGERCWINNTGQVGLAHRRLAIIDLSEMAAQPMHFPFSNPRYSIVYNGEIYNYIELRDALRTKGYIFTTQSDTEVILAAYDCYKEKCLELFDGMFAFAIWDEQAQRLFAARDRFGEKPFFYSIDPAKNTLWFGSEIKALWSAGVPKHTDEQMLLYYLATGSTQLPLEKHRSYYTNISSLPPAHYFFYPVNDAAISVQRYWDIDKNIAPPSTEKEAMDSFYKLLSRSVTRRLRSDVATGTSLSGGLDSSSIAAIISGLGGDKEKYKSFSAIFPGFEKDESSYIREVTNTFNLSNYTISPTGKSFAADIESLCFHQEQPFDSASVYIQYAVSRLAKEQGVKVLLDGQGADETLAGYTRYIHWFLQGLLSEKKFNTFRSEKKAFDAHGIPFKWGIKNYIAAFAPSLTASMLSKKAMGLIIKNDEIEADFIRAYIQAEHYFKPVIQGVEDILYYNTMQSGLEELLRFADRNSMAFGREIRLPFLDHELVNFIFSLPVDYKIRKGFTKWILRETMKEKRPASITWRKDKSGFEPPQLQWMKEPLLQERILSSRQKLTAAGILKKRIVHTPMRPVPAYTSPNPDWRYLIAGIMLD